MKKKNFILLLIALTGLSFLITVCYRKAARKTKIKAGFNFKKKLSILFFSADYCGPCKKMKEYIKNRPEIQSYLKRNFTFTYYDVTLKKNAQLARFYKIKGIPTAIVLKDNKELMRFHQKTPEEFIETLKQIVKSEN